MLRRSRYEARQAGKAASSIAGTSKRGAAKSEQPGAVDSDLNDDGDTEDEEFQKAEHADREEDQLLMSDYRAALRGEALGRELRGRATRVGKIGDDGVRQEREFEQQVICACERLVVKQIETAKKSEMLKDLDLLELAEVDFEIEHRFALAKRIATDELQAGNKLKWAAACWLFSKTSSPFVPKTPTFSSALDGFVDQTAEVQKRLAKEWQKAVLNKAFANAHAASTTVGGGNFAPLSQTCRLFLQQVEGNPCPSEWEEPQWANVRPVVEATLSCIRGLLVHICHIPQISGSSLDDAKFVFPASGMPKMVNSVPLAKVWLQAMRQCPLWTDRRSAYLAAAGAESRIAPTFNEIFKEIQKSEQSLNEFALNPAAVPLEDVPTESELRSELLSLLDRYVDNIESFKDLRPDAVTEMAESFLNVIKRVYKRELGGDADAVYDEAALLQLGQIEKAVAAMPNLAATLVNQRLTAYVLLCKTQQTLKGLASTMEKALTTFAAGSSASKEEQEINLVDLERALKATAEALEDKDKTKLATV